LIIEVGTHEPEAASGYRGKSSTLGSLAFRFTWNPVNHIRSYGGGNSATPEYHHSGPMICLTGHAPPTGEAALLWEYWGWDGSAK